MHRAESSETLDPSQIFSQSQAFETPLFNTEYVVEQKEISHLFQEVLKASNPVEIKHIAHRYSTTIEFQNNSAMQNTLRETFDLVNDTHQRRNWAIFCVKVLNYKDYNSLTEWKRWIAEHVEKFKTIGDFGSAHVQPFHTSGGHIPERANMEGYVKELKKLLEIKKETLRAKELVDWIEEGKMTEAVYSHGWFTTTSLFLGEIEARVSKDPTKTILIDAAITLIKAQPNLPFDVPYKKLIRRLYQCAKGERRDELKNLREKTLSYIGFRSPRENEIVEYKAVLDKTIQKCVKVDAMNPDASIDEDIAFFAVDLAFKGVSLFHKIQLSDFARSAFSKGTDLPINHMIQYFNYISEFVKSKVASYKSIHEKAAAITFFIKLARKTDWHHDINSTFAIVAALDSAEIKSHKNAWKLVSQELKDKLGYVDISRSLRNVKDSPVEAERKDALITPLNLISPKPEARPKDTLIGKFDVTHNFRKFRASFKMFGDLQIPYVPFLGPLLKDLTGAYEGNASSHRILGSDRTKINKDKAEVLSSILSQFFELKAILNCPEDLQTDIILQIVPANSFSSPSTSSAAAAASGV